MVHCLLMTVDPSIFTEQHFQCCQMVTQNHLENLLRELFKKPQVLQNHLFITINHHHHWAEEASQLESVTCHLLLCRVSNADFAKLASLKLPLSRDYFFEGKQLLRTIISCCSISDAGQKEQLAKQRTGRTTGSAHLQSLCFKYQMVSTLHIPLHKRNTERSMILTSDVVSTCVS